MVTGPTGIGLESQYKECYESWRQHDRLIWQVPAVAVVVDGALLVSTFSLVKTWWVRELLVGIGLILTFVLMQSLVKHRFFSSIEQRTLTALEVRAAVFAIQRTTQPVPIIDYWYQLSAQNFLQNQSAHNLFVTGMIGIILILAAILVFNGLFPDSVVIK